MVAPDRPKIILLIGIIAIVAATAAVGVLMLPTDTERTPLSPIPGPPKQPTPIVGPGPTPDVSNPDCCFPGFTEEFKKSSLAEAAQIRRELSALGQRGVLTDPDQWTPALFDEHPYLSSISMIGGFPAEYRDQVLAFLREAQPVSLTHGEYHLVAHYLMSSFRPTAHRYADFSLSAQGAKALACSRKHAEVQLLQDFNNGVAVLHPWSWRVLYKLKAVPVSEFVKAVAIPTPHALATRFGLGASDPQLLEQLSALDSFYANTLFQGSRMTSFEYQRPGMVSWEDFETSGVYWFATVGGISLGLNDAIEIITRFPQRSRSGIVLAALGGFTGIRYPQHVHVGISLEDQQFALQLRKAIGRYWGSPDARAFEQKVASQMAASIERYYQNIVSSCKP